MYCKNCGNYVDGAYCQVCGNAVIPNKEHLSNKSPTQPHSQIVNGQKPKRKKINGCGLSFLITIGILGGILILFFIAGIISGLFGSNSNRNSDATNSTVSAINSTGNSTNIVQTTKIDETASTPNSAIGDLTDPILLENFIIACYEIDLNPDKIDLMSKIDNWASGERYQFVYYGNSLTLYAFEDMTVSSIKIGNSEIYKQGYSALSVNDYLIDTTTLASMETLAIEKVKQYLAYPDASDFPWVDGYSFGRVKDIYVVSGYVNASNAFGVTSEVDYYVEFRKDGDSFSTEFLYIDGEIYVGTESVIKEEELTEIPIQTGSTDTSSNESFTIIGGTLGIYGVAYSEDGFDYIDYYIPVGRYMMSSSSSNTNVFMCSVEEYTNSDGYAEPVDMQTFQFTTGEEVYTIDITEAYYLTIPETAKINFAVVE